MVDVFCHPSNSNEIYTLEEFISYFDSDFILVKIGFYVGEEKEDIGNWPYMTLLAITAGAMILSEVMISMNFSFI